MKRFVEGVDRGQSTLFPNRLEDWIGDDNPVRVTCKLAGSMTRHSIPRCSRNRDNQKPS
jgi:hypothetical protein